MPDKRQVSDKLTEKDAATIKTLLVLGHQQKRIASLFDVNQGRISEIASGKKRHKVKALHDRIRQDGVIPADYLK